MKKKIAILGSTGSIGKTLLNIIDKDKKNFNIVLLTANQDYKTLIKQAKKFKVKNIVLTNRKCFEYIKKKNIKKISIYNNFDNFKKIFPSKIDYVMSSIVGLDGLKPTVEIIKFTKKIAIANKESIICGWNIIKKELDKNKTKFIPVDSEHFSIWYALKNNLRKNINKIYLTASGGSVLNVPKKKIIKLKIKDFLKHPNWKMGEKITIDSSTLMNKVFEIIEAKKIFNLKYSQLGIIIHPQSYIHAIIEYNDGLIKIIAHETTMKIPIFNTLYDDNKSIIKIKKIDFNKLNCSNFKLVDKKKFPSVNILKKLPNTNSLFETVIVATNDELVKLFLNKKIKYNEIYVKIMKIINKNEFLAFKKYLPRKVSEVINTSELVRSKIKSIYKNKYEK